MRLQRRNESRRPSYITYHQDWTLNDTLYVVTNNHEEYTEVLHEAFNTTTHKRTKYSQYRLFLGKHNSYRGLLLN